jgi:hypothetical protein
MHAASVYPEPGSNSPKRTDLAAGTNLGVRLPAHVYWISCHSSFVKVQRPCHTEAPGRNPHILGVRGPCVNREPRPGRVGSDAPPDAVRFVTGDGADLVGRWPPVGAGCLQPRPSSAWPYILGRRGRRARLVTRSDGASWDATGSLAGCQVSVERVGHRWPNSAGLARRAARSDFPRSAG